MPKTKRSHSIFDILSFFGLTFLISWGIWIAMIANQSNSQGWFWVAGFGPTLSSLILVVIRGGWRNLGSKFKLNWRLKPRWYSISILGTPLVMLVSLGLYIALGGAMPRYLDSNHIFTTLDQWPLIFVIYIYIFIFTALGEEVGWRGYALPGLLTRFSPFFTSIILGLVWACWHLPLFWMTGTLHAQLPVFWFFLQILGSTFIYTWMFNHTRGSLWIAFFFHTSSNAAVGLLPILPLDNGGSLTPLWIVVALLWILVGILLWGERKTFFLRPPDHQNTINYVRTTGGKK